MLCSACVRVCCRVPALPTLVPLYNVYVSRECDDRYLGYATQNTPKKINHLFLRVEYHLFETIRDNG